jgi:hypothetical protein
MESLLNSGEIRQLELEDDQGALTLPPPANAAKKSA